MNSIELWQTLRCKLSRGIDSLVKPKSVFSVCQVVQKWFVVDWNTKLQLLQAGKSLDYWITEERGNARPPMHFTTSQVRHLRRQQERERDDRLRGMAWSTKGKEQAGEGVISSPAQPKSAWLWDSGEIEVELSVVKPNAHLSLLVTLSCFESHFTLNSSKGKEWL